MHLYFLNITPVILMDMIEKPSELDGLHRWDSPKRRLRKSASEKAMLDTGGDARECPLHSLNGLSIGSKSVVNLNVTDTSARSLGLL